MRDLKKRMLCSVSGIHGMLYIAALAGNRDAATFVNTQRTQQENVYISNALDLAMRDELDLEILEFMVDLDHLDRTKVQGALNGLIARTVFEASRSIRSGC